MATCQNCNKKLSCGCQKRNASDGKSVCTSCIGNYEMTIKKNIQVTKPTQLTNVWGTKAK